MTDYDVVIIGAGPAGCATAIACAQHGLRVAIVERLSFPRERPGETLHPGIEPLLKQLGVMNQVQAGKFIRPFGNWVTWDKERNFTPFGNDADGAWSGFQIPRSTLDGFLLAKAIALGVQALQPCHAKKVLLENGRVMGVQTLTGALSCRQLVDASGAHGWLTRQLGLGSRCYSPPLTALYGYTSGTVDESALGIFADRLGWYWTAQVGRKLYHWTRLYFEHAQICKASAVPSSFEHLTHVGKMQGADVTWRICEQSAGNGYFIAGDASTVIDPGASHGVLKALMSGMMAAQAVIEGCDNPTNQQVISLQYRRWIRDWFESDVKRMRELYRAHPFPPPWLEKP